MLKGNKAVIGGAGKQLGIEQTSGAEFCDCALTGDGRVRPFVAEVDCDGSDSA